MSPIVILVLGVDWLTVAMAALKKKPTTKHTNKKPHPQKNPHKILLARSCKIESSSLIRNTALTFDYSFFSIL